MLRRRHRLLACSIRTPRCRRWRRRWRIRGKTSSMEIRFSLHSPAEPDREIEAIIEKSGARIDCFRVSVRGHPQGGKDEQNHQGRMLDVWAGVFCSLTHISKNFRQPALPRMAFFAIFPAPTLLYRFGVRTRNRRDPDSIHGNQARGQAFNFAAAPAASRR